MIMNTIADIRKDYRLRSLSEEDVAADPLGQFSIWWEDAVASNIDEINAMTLATADGAGRPSAGIVLLKGLNSAGFEFFTNYESHKAKNIEVNKNAALVFFWKELERQVRVEGTIAKTTEAVSDEYFFSRPRESQIGAWASPQSAVISSRQVIDDNFTAIRKRVEENKIERPPFWGGYIVKPVMMEFWQGRPNRLHDRIAYYAESGAWVIKRLAP